jgi:predicted amidophosphoribosyltransferase
MNWPRCKAGNAADARFCEDCGARLTLACPQCGAEVSPGKRFCRSCGAALAEQAVPAVSSPASYTPKHLAQKILTSKAALEGDASR